MLIELSNSDIDADLARWRSESLPVSWGVDRDRYPGDVDLTETGFRLMAAITQQEYPDLKRSPMTGYNNETPGLHRSCYWIEPPGRSFLWVAANELPCSNELVP